MPDLPQLNFIYDKLRATDGPVELTPEEAQTVRLQAVKDEFSHPPLNRRMRRLIAKAERRSR